MKLSVVILTKNEERNILDCIENVLSADEIILIDDNSKDRTVEIVKSLKDKKIKVFKRSLEGNFSSQRNFGLDKAKNEWVLFLDADERVNTALFSEITGKIDEGEFSAYKVRRLDVLWGKKLKFGETGNIKIIRLAQKNAGRFKGKVHEVWNVKGKVGEFKNELLHFPHQTFKEFVSEINYYSSIRAKELEEENIKTNFVSIIAYTKAKFILNYFVKLGFLDGTIGLVFALMMSFHSFLVRSKLWLLNNTSKP